MEIIRPLKSKRWKCPDPRPPIQAKWPRPDLIPVSLAWSDWEYFYSPLDQWDASPSQGYPPSIIFAGTQLYTWVERGTVRVKSLAQEHNTMSPTRARTQTARSRDERTNHEATASPTEDDDGNGDNNVEDDHCLRWCCQRVNSSEWDLAINVQEQNTSSFSDSTVCQQKDKTFALTRLGLSTRLSGFDWTGL